jgi:hypothetical protein
MKINLTQKEAQALLLSANEMLDEVSKLNLESLNFIHNILNS